MLASTISVRLCGGMLVAMPTAMPELPLISRFGNARGQNFGLRFALVVVGLEIDGFLVDVFEQRGGDARKARFGVPHGRGRIAIDGAEVALAIDQRIAHAKTAAPCGPTRRKRARRRAGGICPSTSPTILAHLRVGRLKCRPISLHAVKDAAVDRLQAVANVGQGAAHDHAHGVIEVRAAHLVFDIDGNEVLVAVAGWRRGGWNPGFVCQKVLRSKGDSRFYFSMAGGAESVLI